MNSATTSFPDIHIDIRRVVAECDLVVTHGLLTGAVPIFTELGSKVVDIFRLDEHGKIVEHWDVLAPISPSPRTATRRSELSAQGRVSCCGETRPGAWRGAGGL